MKLVSRGEPLQRILLKGTLLGMSVSILLAAAAGFSWQRMGQFRARSAEEQRVRDAVKLSFNNPSDLLDRLSKLPVECAFIEREGGNLPVVGDLDDSGCAGSHLRSRAAMNWDEPFRGSLVFALNDSAIPVESSGLPLSALLIGVALAAGLTGWILLQLMKGAVIYPLRAVTAGLGSAEPPRVPAGACGEVEELVAELGRGRDQPES